MAVFERVRRFFPTVLKGGKKLAMVCLVPVSLAIVMALQMPPSREYQIKAAFIFNFTQFVEWPQSAFQSEQDSPLVIAVVGKNPFGTYLEETVRGEYVNGHPLVIRHYISPEAVEPGAHIVFLNLSKEKEERDLLRKLHAAPSLTISDSKDFCQSGGIIRFFTERNKVRLQINAQAAKEAGLTISSNLLRIAEPFSAQN